MAFLSWLGIFMLLFVYECDSTERLKNLVRIDRFTRTNDTHENRDLPANLKNVENAAKDKGNERKQAKNGHKKQVVDAIHLGPYHHGHSWGTTSVWPGFAGWGHSWGYPGHHIGWTGYPSYKSQIPSKNSAKVPLPSTLHNSQSVKRWWPGYMGGWGNWGWGNSGYPGWGSLGWGHQFDWLHPLLRSGIPRVAESLSKRWWPGYMGGWGGWGWGNAGYPGWGGWGHGNWRGHGLGYPHRSQVPKSSSAPKRHYIDVPFDGFGEYFGDGFNFPWGAPMPDYGPFNDLGEWGYPEFGFGPMPLLEFNQDAYYKSKIPKQNDKRNKEESGVTRQFVHGFHPGSYGWGGVIYPGVGLGGILPLLGAHTGYPVAGPFYKSMVPKREEKGERHQVINYHPGCYGWGGCLYPGCGYMGSFGWPCHHGCCGHCCCRSKTPNNQDPRNERRRSRQEIASPEDDGDEEKKQTFGSSMERSTSDFTKMAMGFPGMENFRSPFGSNIDPLSGSVASQLGISNQLPTPAMNEPNELMPQPDGLSEFPQSYKSSEETTNELSAETAKPTEDLMTNFNMNPEADTGMPLTTDAGDSTAQASRRGIIPETKEREIQKKQAVTYPYPSPQLPYYMAHGGNPYTAVASHVGGYPVGYLPGAQLVGHVADPLHPSHSIHVGAPNVNVDVQTTRTHVVQSPENGKQRSHVLKTFLNKATKKVKK